MISPTDYLLLEGSGDTPFNGAIVGSLRTRVHGSTANRDLTYSFEDDTGPRRLVGFSWFCAVRDNFEEPDASEDLMGLAQKCGYTYVRDFRVLGYDNVNPWGSDVGGDTGYFAGRGVSPVTGIERHVAFAKLCKKYKIRIQCSCGHQWNSTQERLKWEFEFWNTMKNEGVIDVFIFVEGDNEYWQNATMRNSDEQIREYYELYKMIKGIAPSIYFTCGAPQDESPSKVWRALGRIQNPQDPKPGENTTIELNEFCPTVDVHTSRDDTPGVGETVKRPFSLGYNEGNVGMYHVPILHGEPRPSPGPDAFSPSDKPGRLMAGYSEGQFWGGALTQFSGQAVRGRGTDGSKSGPWNISKAIGFIDVPRLLNFLPQNIGDSAHQPSGNVWWWKLPDGRIGTAVDELWGGDTLGNMPVKRCLIIGPNWEVKELNRAPNRSDYEGHGGALVIGEL